MNLPRLLTLGVLTCAAISTANVKPAQLFSDNMVIQRETQAPIWGWADAGEKVTVKGSWGEEATVLADESGKWMTKLQTPVAGGPYTLTFIGKNTVVYKNILSGDVWLCSGQSNMEYPVSRLKNMAKDIKTADYPEIRHIRTVKQPSPTPLQDVEGNWQVCSPKTVGGFSATAYFFAREIYNDQKIPLGLLCINWGGTRIEPWIPPVGFDGVPELKQLSLKVSEVNPLTPEGNKAYKKYVSDLKLWMSTAEIALNATQELPPQPIAPTLGTSHQSPTYLYNGMIHPIVPTAIKGAIWYQGESNGNEGDSYYHKKQALINGWRKVFNQGDFPFYFVQLANFKTSDSNNAEGGDGWAKLRQAQIDSLKIKNTGMAVIIDVGEAGDIHPRNKQDVGKRLARWALAKDYGKDIVYSGPLYKKMTIEGNKAIISFDHVGGGLMTATKTGEEFPEEDKGAKVTWCSIRGKDHVWYKADAVIKGATVVVSSKEVAHPTGVRYAFTMNPEGCNLYNKEGLPASPFTAEK